MHFAFAKGPGMIGWHGSPEFRFDRYLLDPAERRLCRDGHPLVAPPASPMGSGQQSLRRSVAVAAAIGGAAGTAIALLGGRLMGGSLDLLARQFPGSRLRLDRLGALFGEQGFGPISQTVTSGLQGALFGAFTVGAMILPAAALPRGERRPQAAMS